MVENVSAFRILMRKLKCQPPQTKGLSSHCCDDRPRLKKGFLGSHVSSSSLMSDEERFTITGLSGRIEKHSKSRWAFLCRWRAFRSVLQTGPRSIKPSTQLNSDLRKLAHSTLRKHSSPHGRVHAWIPG